MGYGISLADLQRAGITLTADEAVAIVQALIHTDDRATPEPPFGPPSMANVRLAADGSVDCRACEVTPAVAEIAILLQAMLADASHVPGGLRYAIARALHEVDAPPFDSIAEFSATLARYGPADRPAVIRRLVGRVQATTAADGVLLDRRRAMRSRDDRRRQLRDADRRNRVVPITTPPPRQRKVWTAGAVLVAVAAVVGAGDAIRSHDATWPVVSPPAIATSGSNAPEPDMRDQIHPVIATHPLQPARVHDKRPVRAAHAAPGRTRRVGRSTSAPRVLDTLRLRWLRHVISLNDDLSGGL